MNTPPLRLLASALATAFVLSSASLAQSPTRLVPVADAQAATSKATLNAKWTDTSQTFVVEYHNDTNALLRIDGIQTSNGLYVVDFPKNVPKKGSADITLIHSAQPGMSSTVDLVRLLTSDGEKIIQVVHSREAVVSFDTKVLSWTVGGPAAPQTVTITVAPNTSAPTAVRALGEGNYAKLESLGANTYRVTVTPGTTAQANRFPVFVDFNPALPGVATVITGDVAAPRN